MIGAVCMLVGFLAPLVLVVDHTRKWRGRH